MRLRPWAGLVAAGPPMAVAAQAAMAEAHLHPRLPLAGNCYRAMRIEGARPIMSRDLELAA